ncbi:TnsA-like heteromeric transposase endonuclease subunit [Streptomyces sp. NPDC102467]|uniref:TnsA-like heteromeric transposase endonuclease subunit n=1 Tax=Streptomyces sp. NPDC102467 TaxID=3366179 RepID=UPI003826D15A
MAGAGSSQASGLRPADLWRLVTAVPDELAAGGRRHTPDFFARGVDGTGIVIDVRADDRIEERDAAAFAATERACSEVGWEFRRVGVPDPVFMANVRWLAGYRHSRIHRAEVGRRLTEVFTAPSPYRHLLRPTPEVFGEETAH